MANRTLFPLLAAVLAIILFFAAFTGRKGVTIYPDGYYHYFENGKYKKVRADSVRLCPN
jgi:hypothetical protein